MQSPPTNSDRMLQMDDLLQLAGDEQLGGFSWGEAVRGELNSFLSKDRQITETHTGNQTLALIRTLPIHAVIRIGTLYIDPRTGEAVYRDPSKHQQHVMVREVVRDVRRRARAENDHDDSIRPAVDDPATKSLHGRVMLMVASAVVAVTFMLTFTVTDPKNQGKGEVRSSTLEVALKVLGDIFVGAAQTAPQPQDAPRRRDDYPDQERPRYDDTDSPANGPRPADNGPDYRD